MNRGYIAQKITPEDFQNVLRGIQKARDSGMEIFAESWGASHGPICDHCGRSGINLVAVMAIPREVVERREVEDEAQYVIAMFGKGCLKHTDIKLRSLKEVA